MSRIPIPAVEEAPAASRSLLAEADKRLGMVPNLYHIVSTSGSGGSGELLRRAMTRSVRRQQ